MLKEQIILTVAVSYVPIITLLLSLCFYLNVFRMIKPLRVGDKEKIYCLYCLTSKSSNNLYMAKCWIRLNWIVKQKNFNTTLIFSFHGWQKKTGEKSQNANSKFVSQVLSLNRRKNCMVDTMYCL